MKWLMAVYGTAAIQFEQVRYLVSFDAEAHDGRGDALFTLYKERATRFDSFKEVMELWGTISKVRPLREDGKPNRPLTTFTISPEKVDEP